MNKQIKILVIEDDPDICELLTLYAEKSGYIVIIFTDVGGEHGPGRHILAPTPTIEVQQP